MKWHLILVFILLLPAVQSYEDYQHYSILDIESNVEGRIIIKSTGTEPQVKNLTANVSFYPRQTTGQEIITSKILTEPIVDESIIEGGALNLLWADANVGNYEYSITRTIRKENRFHKIKEKIPFPTEFNQNFTKYTQPTEFIDITPEIRSKATELTEGETDYYRIIFKIAGWVEESVSYNLSTLTSEAVQKSSWVLKNKKGVCDELTNLYISMLRSIGIPSRFISGQVYTSDEGKFGNHGWAEVYFPQIGWVPVDVTFGQFGWIDPSHVIFKISIDSGESSAEYTWKSIDAKITIEELKINSKIIKSEKTVKQEVKLDIEPLVKKAAYESYIPLQVTITNPHNYYVPLTLYITKAPGLEGTNRKTLLIRPREKKDVFWMIKLPKAIERNTRYKAILETKTGFGANSTTHILYGNGYKKYSKAQAESMISELETKEEKDYFPNLRINCDTDRTAYYKTETAQITCNIKNTGNTKLENIKTCIKEECKGTSLTIGEDVDYTWSLDTSKQTNPKTKITVENGNLLKAEYVTIKIVENPELKIDKIEPKQFEYKKKTNLTLSITTEARAKDVEITLKNIATINIENVEGEETVKVPFNPKKARKGKIYAFITYKDELGKAYTSKQTLSVNITNLPWYIKLINFIFA